MKPGKPILYATLAGRRHIFGLPGNPLSAMTGFYEFALPALLRMSGLPPDRCRPALRLPLARRSPQRAAASASCSRASSGTKPGRAWSRWILEAPPTSPPAAAPTESSPSPRTSPPWARATWSNSGRGGRCHDREKPQSRNCSLLRGSAATALLRFGHGPLPAPLRPLHAARRRGEIAARGHPDVRGNPPLRPRREGAVRPLQSPRHRRRAARPRGDRPPGARCSRAREFRTWSSRPTARRWPGRPHDLRRAGLRRINVSLPSLDEKTYAELTRGGALGADSPRHRRGAGGGPRAREAEYRGSPRLE